MLVSTICGCSTIKYSNNAVLDSLNVAVLENTRIEHWQHLFLEKTPLFYRVGEGALVNGLETGLYDIAIGLPFVDKPVVNKVYLSKPVAWRKFNFYVRKQDSRSLHKYYFFSSFSNEIERVGFVSAGEAGVVNRMIVKQSKIARKFTPCGKMVECLALLDNKKLDSLFFDERQFFSYKSAIRMNGTNEMSAINKMDGIVPTRFGYKQPFSIMLNERTLSVSEIRQVKELIF